MDRLFVLFSKEILCVVQGRVSTEADARLSFDRKAQIDQSVKLVKVRTKNFRSLNQYKILSTFTYRTRAIITRSRIVSALRIVSAENRGFVN